jgi:hypothetical protein
MSKTSKLKEIYEGWKNVIFPTPEIKALAKERALVCAECDVLVFGVCSRCCCPHMGKTHSPDSRCPMNKWKDGWGVSTGSQVPGVIYSSLVDPPEIPILYWNEEKKDWTGKDPNLPFSLETFNLKLETL